MTRSSVSSTSCSWALSRKTLPGNKFWMMYFIIPIFFGGGLIEAAKIDGAGHFMTCTHVVLPLAKAIMAVMPLYYAAGQ